MKGIKFDLRGTEGSSDKRHLRSGNWLLYRTSS